MCAIVGRWSCERDGSLVHPDFGTLRVMTSARAGGARGQYFQVLRRGVWPGRNTLGRPPRFPACSAGADRGSTAVLFGLWDPVSPDGRATLQKMSDPRPMFIINPVAGGGRGRRAHATIGEFLAPRASGGVEFAFTERPGCSQRTDLHAPRVGICNFRCDVGARKPTPAGRGALVAPDASNHRRSSAEAGNLGLPARFFLDSLRGPQPAEQEATLLRQLAASDATLESGEEIGASDDGGHQRRRRRCPRCQPSHHSHRYGLRPE